jgi:succinylglutamic semialdehyde dehydrogenase
MTDATEAVDEELFGPVLQVWRVRSFEDAIRLANATRFGLSGGLISDDASLWERVQQDLRAGVLNWNRPTTGASGAMPFGGPGLSGSARPSAYYAVDYCAWPVATQRADKAVPLAAPGLPS